MRYQASLEKKLAAGEETMGTTTIQKKM